MTTPLCFDGISAMVLNYFKQFDKNQFQYEFAHWNDVPDAIKNDIESRGGVLHKLPVRVKKPFQYYIALKRLIKERHYSIVHAHGNSSTLYIEMLAAKHAGVQIRISHSHSSMCSYVLLHKLLKPLFHKSYTNAFTCSKKAGEWLFNGIYEIVNNGIDLDKYSFKSDVSVKTRNELGMNEKRISGHVGNYIYAKNHDYLIDIFAALIKKNDNYRLLLIGEGELINSIKDKVYRLGIDSYVLILGQRNDVPELLQAMDIFVMPSRYEGLPFVLIEAQAAGLPCIVSSNITREVNLTGLVSYVSLEESPECWANVIENSPQVARLHSSTKACEDLRNAGYDITLEAKKLEKQYLSMIEGKL